MARSNNGRLLLECWEIGPAHGDWVTALAWSSDGTRFASAADGIKVWSAIDGTLLACFPPDSPGHSVKRLSFILDDSEIVATYSDGRIKIWDAGAREEIKSTQRHCPSQLVSLPDGWEHRLTIDGRSYFVNHNTASTTLKDPRAPSPSSAQDASPNKGSLATMSENTVYRQEVAAVAISPNGSSIVSITVDGHIEVWKTGTGRLHKTFWHDTRSGTKHAQIAFLPDTSRLAVCNGNEIMFWNATTWKRHKVAIIQSQEILCMAFSIDSAKIATVSKDGTLTIWSTKTGQKEVSFPIGGREYNFSLPGLMGVGTTSAYPTFWSSRRMGVILPRHTVAIDPSLTQKVRV